MKNCSECIHVKVCIMARWIANHIAEHCKEYKSEEIFVKLDELTCSECESKEALTIICKECLEV